eukprot:TRINITY_DN6604_c0_g4_i1.p1 TRINITY_DN6604_c0_g4~~TRINITY_DN6604_c0_g4_i1.p1  ORF type:complete len:141 (-),score=47.78 TRINITY_DN6604_c0_g4_i1:10-432(-)
MSKNKNTTENDVIPKWNMVATTGSKITVKVEPTKKQKKNKRKQKKRKREDSTDSKVSPDPVPTAPHNLFSNPTSGSLLEISTKSVDQLPPLENSSSVDVNTTDQEISVKKEKKMKIKKEKKEKQEKKEKKEKKKQKKKKR